jgi:hypothetical protein
MFSNFTKSLPQLDLPTANEVVEANRSIATAMINLIPHVQTKDAIAKASSSTLSAATLFADQFDKATKQLKVAMGV